MKHRKPHPFDDERDPRHRHPEHEGRGHHHGHFGHGPGGPGGPGNPGRFFESGDLRFVILHLISDAPRHGYEIIKMIESQMSGAYSPSPGIIYPTLTMLEEMGLAAVQAEGSRKLYSITDDGKRELKANRATVDAILERIQHAGERYARDKSGPIMRAMENLKLVLRMRGSQWTPDQLTAATDILDDAAKKIERL